MGSLQVLVVEDNEVNRLVTALALRSLGADVSFAEDGAVAVQRIANGPLPDVILMDCQMPVMDGLEATRQIRAMGGRAAAIPIIALTAGVMEEEQAATRRAGMNGFLAKPLQRDALEKALMEHVGVT